MRISPSGRAMAVWGIVLGAMPGTALAAYEECVHVAGNESSGEKLTLDPAFQISLDDAALQFAIYNRLVDLDANFEVIPELAESWEVADDGRSWTFHLRRDVKFHDGSDFDAKDVVHTFRRILDPALASPAGAIHSFLTADGIKAIDAHTVQFTTAEPVAELPLLLTNKFTPIVSEGATLEQLKETAVGTGPFMVEKFRVGDPVRIFRRNPNYWKAGLPKAECLKISVVQEALPAMAALQAGQADLILSLDATTIPTLQANPDIVLLETGAGTVLTLSMFTDTPPFDDSRVRQAMKLVIDRQVLVDTVLLGFGEPGNDNPVPPTWPAAYSDQPLQRDVEKAKALLAEAGHADGLTVDLFTGEAVTGMVKLSEAYREMASEAGITVNVNVTPADSFWDDVWLKRPFATSAWGIRPPIEALSIAYTKDADWNETHWRRDDYDQLIETARTEIDPAKRAEALKQAQRLLTEEGGVIIPFFIHQVGGMRKACTGFQMHAQNFNLNYEELSCSDKG